MLKKIVLTVGISVLCSFHVNAQNQAEYTTDYGRRQLIQAFVANYGYDQLVEEYQKGQVDFQQRYGYFPQVSFEDFVWQVMLAMSGVDTNALTQQQLSMHQQYLALNQASFEAGQAAYRDLNAAYGAYNQSWSLGQATLGQVATDYGNAAIKDQWSVYDPSSGTITMMPLYPSPDANYTDQAGNPLVFDQSTSGWYQLDSFGNRTQLPWTPNSTGF